VQERTNELAETNQELQTINEELGTTLEALQEKNDIIQKKNQDITASINYAQRIQQAILPDWGRVAQVLPHSFVLYQPRNIVSGDFYWFAQKADRVILAVADCTGHGVPGAFMSMIGHDLLNQIVNDRDVLAPHLILAELHRGTRTALKQASTQNRDGMDMAIVSLVGPAPATPGQPPATWQRVEFAGAKSDLVVVQNGQVHRFRGNRHPIGGEQLENERTFDLQVLAGGEQPALAAGEAHFYLCSDGLQDQFGGPTNTKFMSKKLRQLLLDHHAQPPAEQQAHLAQALAHWTDHGHVPQTDDITVLGWRTSLAPPNPLAPSIREAALALPALD
jgi:serine phosphatase RsbU (regulator of sigma subunit)